MKTRTLGSTGLDISSVVFGGNVFGWTLDETESFRMLDACVENGITTLDTADVYSRWKPGNQGGESETTIGDWLASNPGKREKVQIFTKVGMDLGDDKTGLAPKYIREAVEASLSRLKTDYIDLYFSHRFDPEVPHAETLGTYKDLLDEGKIRSIGASNFNEGQLEDALKVSAENDLPAYQVLQPEYSLVSRASFEGPLQRFCVEKGIGVVTYFSLAAGFLSGKYRSKDDLAGQSRGMMVEKYLEEGGVRVLEAMDDLAATKDATLAELAIAWLLHKEGVTAPIASATKESHLKSLVKAAEISLTPEEVASLEVF
ncbi:aldo/keto reductase [Ponticaulis sp.]|uniref:aldo/keto reductase n=1 Tax=Ponticaulis sp. TaxID=2020902 RepID=UPI000B684B22|nr:aldo/keto reductase [Ponticaulis sp.]MAI90342.1 alcohol dehydrogenase [Ponticaulis sp.]OUY00294.1 MAG: alcohol dehydrogenase [Hyphomonadaceae bacterium TMED5]